MADVKICDEDTPDPWMIDANGIFYLVRYTISVQTKLICRLSLVATGSRFGLLKRCMTLEIVERAVSGSLRVGRHGLRTSGHRSSTT
jgi:hypothetical protein